MVERLSNVQAIVEDYIDVLESKGVHVEKAILFGSFARGTPRDGSDIDLAIISSDLGRFEYIERLQFLSRATLNVPGPLEVLGYTPDEIKEKEGKSIIWDEIRKTGKVVYEAA